MTKYICIAFMAVIFSGSAFARCCPGDCCIVGGYKVAEKIVRESQTNQAEATLMRLLSAPGALKKISNLPIVDKANEKKNG